MIFLWLNDVWRRNLAYEAAGLAAGELDPAEPVLAKLFPESLLRTTDRAPAVFEERVRALDKSSDDEVMQAVRSVVLALNAVNDEHNGAGYETCKYIDQTLTKASIDGKVVADLRRTTAPADPDEVRRALHVTWHHGRRYWTELAERHDLGLPTDLFTEIDAVL